MSLPNLILFDIPVLHKQLLPLTFTRPISEIRCGIFNLREKWEFHFGKASWLTEDYLKEVFPCKYSVVNLYINSAVISNPSLVESISKLQHNEALFYKENLLALRSGELKREDIFTISTKKIELENVKLIERPWHIFQFNGNEIKNDFELIKSKRMNNGVQDKYTIVYNPEQVFIDENVKIKAAVFNAEAGPIYIGPNCEVQEGSLIRGPFAMGEGSVLSMGCKIKGDTTIGPFCKIGGEISNSVVFGYSNKGHDGFMGNSVLGEWCNLGADTNTSNLKNNYSDVSVYSYAENGMVNTGSQFCGLTMGDHSKAGINTMFNTGTVVGVSANVFEGDFPPKHVPSFSWGKEVYEFSKSIETAKKVMLRRGKILSEEGVRVLEKVFNYEL
ncbi:MAG: glucose-1-phosphate thymidylyltransferase [Opitutaceae bacterium]|nr:glucose-1-phosphate thymidylyltransferase [Cytophagales bacterium]